MITDSVTELLSFVSNFRKDFSDFSISLMLADAYKS